MMLRTCFLFALLTSICGRISFAAPMVLDFEEWSLAGNTAEPADASQVPLVSSEVLFNRTWNSDFSCCPGAWAISNQTDLHTPGFDTLGNSLNEYSAYHLPAGGGALGSTNFLVAFGEASTVNFPERSVVDGMYITNTTYTFRAVVDGIDSSDANGQDHRAFVKGPFSDGDWFRMDVIGYVSDGGSTGEVSLYLADYRNGQQTAISEWTWLDLSSLGAVDRLGFRFSSSDVGSFGINTPAYFAMDNLTFASVPEPGYLTRLFLFAFGLVQHWRRRVSQQTT